MGASMKQQTILLKSAWDMVNIGHTPGTLHIREQHLPDVPVDRAWAIRY